MRRFFADGTQVHEGMTISVDYSGIHRLDRFTLGQLVDSYCRHHDPQPGKPPGKPSCCPTGNCGLTAVVGNASTLIRSMAVEHRCDTVPAPMVKKYVGEALALLAATGDHTGAWEDPADVRLARAVRVLTEFITLVDPPEEKPCGTG